MASRSGGDQQSIKSSEKEATNEKAKQFTILLTPPWKLKKTLEKIALNDVKVRIF